MLCYVIVECVKHLVIFFSISDVKPNRDTKADTRVQKKIIKYIELHSSVGCSALQYVIAIVKTHLIGTVFNEGEKICAESYFTWMITVERLHMLTVSMIFWAEL